MAFLYDREAMAGYVRRYANQVGGQRALARRLGVSPGYINDLCSGRRAPGPLILKHLGFERVTLYRRRRACRRMGTRSRKSVQP